MTTLLAALVGALASALAVHELGHALSAVLLGGHVERVQWRALGARVLADLPSARAQVAFLLAGAGANLAIAGCVGALAIGRHSSTMTSLMWLFAGIHLAHAGFALLPAGTNDGARLLAMARVHARRHRGDG